MNDSRKNPAQEAPGTGQKDNPPATGLDCPASINELQSHLREFVEARDWSQFHSPKNLAMALVGEAGELAAEFQWLTEPESADLPEDKLERVRLEMADVLIYLVRLADELNVNLLEAASEKTALNEQRYPANVVKGKAAKYSEYASPENPGGGEPDSS